MGSRTVRFVNGFFDNTYGLFEKGVVYKNIPDDIVLPKSAEVLEDPASEITRFDTVREKEWDEEMVRPIGAARKIPSAKKAAAKKAAVAAKVA